MIHVHRALLERARQARAVEVPFRCDTPATARRLRLRLLARSAGTVLCESTVVDQWPARVPLWDRSQRRSGETIAACSWCKKVHVAARWLEPDAAVEALALFLMPALPQVSHTICPACSDRLLAEL